MIIRTLKASAANNVKVKDLLTDDDKKRIRGIRLDSYIFVINSNINYYNA